MSAGSYEVTSIASRCTGGASALPADTSLSGHEGQSVAESDRRCAGPTHHSHCQVADDEAVVAGHGVGAGDGAPHVEGAPRQRRRAAVAAGPVGVHQTADFIAIAYYFIWGNKNIRPFEEEFGVLDELDA